MNQFIKSNDIKNVILLADKNHENFLIEIKNKIHGNRLRAALAVNREVIELYWYIGQQVLVKQAETNWGGKLVETLANDLQHAFPETAGFSKRNLYFMCQFAREYPDLEIVKQSVSQLPWAQIILLIQRVKDHVAREWYVEQSLVNGWSRFTLARYVRQNLFLAQAFPQNKVSNFLKRLSSPQSTLAQELLKSPYNFDFLGLHDEAHEREIEHASIQHITKFMLELGRKFAFVGHQVPIVIDDNEFFIDMLFYNLKLRCYMVCEIKSTKFKPEHAGQLNFYLNTVDDLMRHPQDNPTIGLLLCKSRNKVIAEYALKSIEKPIGVSEYELTKVLPEQLKNVMPSIEEIETELSNSDDEAQEKP